MLVDRFFRAADRSLRLKQIIPGPTGWAGDRLSVKAPVAWIVVLLVQSVPYASALLVSLASAFPLPARLLGTHYRPIKASGKRAETDPAS